MQLIYQLLAYKLVVRKSPYFWNPMCRFSAILSIGNGSKRLFKHFPLVLHSWF